jgi:hypothetical protein
VRRFLNWFLNGFAITFAIPTVLILISWNALPGERLYGLKTGLEDVALGLTIKTPLAPILSVKYTQRRFSEANSLLSQKGSTFGYLLLIEEAKSSTDLIADKQDKGQAKELISKMTEYKSQIESKKVAIKSGAVVVPVAQVPGTFPIAQVPAPLPGQTQEPLQNQGPGATAIPTSTQAPLATSPATVYRDIPETAQTTDEVLEDLDETTTQIDAIIEDIRVRVPHQLPENFGGRGQGTELPARPQTNPNNAPTKTVPEEIPVSTIEPTATEAPPVVQEPTAMPTESTDIGIPDSPAE